MRAVDTSILARYCLQDDPAQARVAREILSGGDVFVPKTVTLELERVLRYAAGPPAGRVIECLAHLIALPGITVEDREQVAVAIDQWRNGVDFADALHLGASAACSELLTLDDRGFAGRARRLDLRPPAVCPVR